MEKKTSFGNCWTYALPKWFRRERRYIIIRASKHTRWWHVMLANDISSVDIEEFVPVEPKTGWRAFFHAPFFKGRVRKHRGDE